MRSFSRSLDVPCMLVSLPIAGILLVLLLVAFYAGVGWFVEWLGPLVMRVFVGLIGVVTLGLGVKALFGVFTGRPTVGYSKPAVVMASLFFVLMGLGLFLLAVVAPLDTTGF